MPCSLHTRLKDVVLGGARRRRSVSEQDARVAWSIGASHVPYFEHFGSLRSGKMRKAQKLLFGDVVEVGACCDDQRAGDVRRWGTVVPARRMSEGRPYNSIGRDLEARQTRQTRGGQYKNRLVAVGCRRKVNATCPVSLWGLTPAPIKWGFDGTRRQRGPTEHTPGFHRAAGQHATTYRFSSSYASCLSLGVEYCSVRARGR